MYKTQSNMNVFIQNFIKLHQNEAEKWKFASMAYDSSIILHQSILSTYGDPDVICEWSYKRHPIILIPNSLGTLLAN